MRILVVEDETKMADYLRKALTESGYAVEIALDGLDGQHLAQESEFDLIILDVMLPGLDGWQLLQIIRRKWQTPVLFLTARDSVDDRVKGLELGADDYLVKPFSYAELLARVRTLLRRSSLTEPHVANDQIQIGNLCIDLSERTVAWREQIVELSSGEYNLLVVLARHAGEVLSRDQILQRLRGIEFNGTDRSVDVAISKLRRKFDDCAGEARKIKTVWGKGYMFSRSEWEC